MKKAQSEAHSRVQAAEQQREAALAAAAAAQEAAAQLAAAAETKAAEAAAGAAATTEKEKQAAAVLAQRPPCRGGLQWGGLCCAWQGCSLAGAAWRGCGVAAWDKKGSCGQRCHRRRLVHLRDGGAGGGSSSMLPERGGGWRAWVARVRLWRRSGFGGGVRRLRACCCADAYLSTMPDKRRKVPM